MCRQVLEWVAQHVAQAGGGPGRYASNQEWRTAVNKRCNAAQPATPFLQDLLQELASQHVSPPSSAVQHLICTCFLTGMAQCSFLEAARIHDKQGP